MDIGRVIDRHYLVQRPLRQGQISTVYQGFDQKLQRVVALKAVPASHAHFYRDAAMRTAQFSHPNIVMLYDLVDDSLATETLYLVQEYIEGQDFSALTQMQLTPYEVMDIGRQICLALVYAAAQQHRVIHGDLTPAAILRDQRGVVRVNNFALPADARYFAAWSTLGGDGIPFAGSSEEERHADDARAAGLLLYQLVTGRLEPPAEGLLRFPPHIPQDVCETIARAILRKHPQRIKDAGALYEILNKLADMLEPPQTAPSSEPVHQEPPVAPVGVGLPPAVLSSSQPQGARSLSTYAAPNPRVETAAALEPNAAPTVADPALHSTFPAQAQYARYADSEPAPSSRSSSLWLFLLLGLVIFALFFIIGYFAGVFIVR